MYILGEALFHFLILEVICSLPLFFGEFCLSLSVMKVCTLNNPRSEAGIYFPAEGFSVSFFLNHFLHSSVSGVVEVQRAVSLNPTFEEAFNIVGEAKHVRLKYCNFRINHCKYWYKPGHN